MTLLKWSLILLIASTLIAAKPPLPNIYVDCSGFKFETELSNVPNETLLNLTVKAVGGQKPYHYVLLDADNTLMSKDFTANKFERLKSGRYRCIVSDNEDCTVEQFIEVK